MYEYIVCLDLGRFQDFSALHVLKVIPRSLKDKSGIAYNDYHVIYQYRTTERYAVLAGKVDLLMKQVKLQDNSVLVVDATGVGAAVVEMFAHDPVAIWIHGGDVVSIREDPPGYNVPKRDLVAVMQVIFQSGRIKIARDLPYNEQLMKELQNMTMTVSTAGNDLYANLKDSIHDDMVMSLALGLWYGEKFLKANLIVEPVTQAAGYDPFKE